MPKKVASCDTVIKGHEGTISGLAIVTELRQACKEMYRNPWSQWPFHLAYQYRRKDGLQAAQPLALTLGEELFKPFTVARISQPPGGRC